MDQMWLMCHGYRLDEVMVLENSDSSSKTIRVQLPLDKFHHDLTYENMGQRVTRNTFWMVPLFAI